MSKITFSFFKYNDISKFAKLILLYKVFEKNIDYKFSMCFQSQIFIRYQKLDEFKIFSLQKEEKILRNFINNFV